MTNPFSVNVPRALEALAVGDQSYKAARDFMQQRQQQQVRHRVAQDILNGGDMRAGIAQLIAGGDIAGATVLGHFGKTDTTNAIREYALLKAQGFPGTFMDWRSALANRRRAFTLWWRNHRRRLHHERRSESRRCGRAGTDSAGTA